jgi:hypothetical protein
MSSRFDSLFDGLREQRPPAPFLPATAVRRRGRQRAHRQAVSAGVAVLAVTGLGAGGLAVAVGQPDDGPPVPPASGSPFVESPSPSPTQSPSPSAVPTEVPQDALLTADDLPGTGWTETGNELFASDPPWFWGCDRYRSEDARSLRLRLDLATASWINNESASQLRLDQVVDLFDSNESATTNVEDVRSVTDQCSWSPSDGGEEAGIEFAVADEGFAGDQAVLIEMRQYAFDGETIAPDPELRFAAVIRVGNAVTTLISDDEQLLRDVAQLAAERLG